MKIRLVLQTGLQLLSLIPAGVFATTVFAHFVWIESPSTVSPEQEEEVRLYFGEFHEFLREEAGGRLDEREGLKAWVVSQDAERQALKLEKETNFFHTTVKLEKPGRYNLIANDHETEVKDGTRSATIGMMYKPMYYARTQLLVFEPGRVSEREAEITGLLDLDIVPLTSHLDPLNGTISPKVGDEVVIQVLFKGEPLAKAKPLAYAPIGWLKELRTNSKGITRFTPLWPGTYVIDCVYLEKAPGQFERKNYQAIRHRATFTLIVVKR